MVGNLKGHVRRKVYFCLKNTHLSDRLEEKALLLVLHSHCYETNTTGEMWHMWKLHTSLLEFYKQLSTLKCSDNQRNCQLSSRGKEWSLGLEGFPGGSAAMNLPALQVTLVQSLGGSEDPLEEEMAPHSSILAWKTSWTEEPGGPQSMGSQRVGHGCACTYGQLEVLRRRPSGIRPCCWVGRTLCCKSRHSPEGGGARVGSGQEPEDGSALRPVHCPHLWSQLPCHPSTHTKSCI